MGRSVPLAGVLAAALLASGNVAAYHDENTRLIDHTAHTLDGSEFRIGLWQLDAGITSRVNVGTNTAPYAASFILKRFIPNIHGKVNLYRSQPLTVSAEARFYYAFAGGAGADASLVIVPLTAYVSSDLTGDLSLHGEVTYTTIAASGRAHVQSLDAKGAVAVQAFQLGAMLEYRVTRVTALLLRGRLQPVFSPAVIRSSVVRDENTNANVEANVEPRYTGATAAVIGGVAFSWKHFNLSLGVGYGSFFVPSLGVVLPGNSILPDGSIDVRF